ncbi:MAG: ABC transporter permease [Anaerolineae bacterium]|nr:ABC transporter permease [Thermoflexus sp.]MDW8064520.1 ABC transporter permease [Anaerolineae bacterium]
MSEAEVLRAIFSVAFLASVLRVTTPILLPALGGLISELAGVINIALEGIMLTAAFVGVVVSAYTQSPWLGLAAALLASALLALGLAFFHLELKADLILSGLALNLLASGGTVFALYSLTGDKGTSAALASRAMPALNLPFLEGVPILGPILNQHNVMVYIAFLMVGVIGLLLYRTRWGIHVRAVGANPEVAASVGLNVRALRYQALVLSGVLAGLGGVYMSMGYLQLFQRDMIAGRGFIALAAVFMGGRRPLGTMLAALLFGAADALANQLGALQIPPQWVQMIPYTATVSALAIYALSQQRVTTRHRPLMFPRTQTRKR